MFGGGGFAGFGQTQAQPAFGAAAAPASPFGAAPNPFGQPQQQAAPAFGAAPAPAFGASTPAFGAAAPAFGAPRPAAAPFGFGGTSAPNPFGAPQQAAAPAFGAPAAPAFGQQPAANPFGGGGAFGQQPAAAPAFGAPAAAPAFGAAPAPAFGQAAAAPLFGASTNVFGQQPAAAAPAPFGQAAPASGGLFGGGGAFGAGSSQQQPGTRSQPFQKTVEKQDEKPGVAPGPPAYFMSLSAMPAYQNKSHEELRWEDYQAGVKGGTGQPSAFGAPAAAPAFGQSPGAFGAPAAPAFGAAPASPGGLFGTPPASSPAFGTPGTTPAFGQAPAASNPFGAPTSPAPFGGFGAASTPAFGQTAAATGSLFGSTAPAFGSTTPAPAFGQSAPAFGSTAAPAAGGGFFNFQSSPAGSAFGQASAAAPAFGTAGTTGFGTGTNPFGAASTAAPSPFGIAPATSSPPAFGSNPFGTGGAFGAPKPAAPSIFGAGFGASAPATGTPGLFGNTGGAFNMFSSTAPATGGNIFGNSSAPAFGSTAPAAGAFALQPFGQQQQQQQQAPAGQPMGVGAAPYGNFPSLPLVPEPKVGISVRSARPSTISGGNARASPLLSLRQSITAPAHSSAKFGVSMPRASPTAAGSSYGLNGSNGMSGGSAEAMQLGTPHVVLPVRAQPYRLFIREPPPSTESAPSPLLTTPARAGRGESQFAGIDDDTTPDRRRTPTRAAETHDEILNRRASPDNRSPDRDQRSSHERDNRHAGQRNGLSSAANGKGGTDGRGLGAHNSSGEDITNAPLPRLGDLASEGYTYSPAPDELASAWREDPGRLRRVSNFTVTRDGIGSIRWTEPVDVTGLQLDRIVSIKQGEIRVYSEGYAKPPQGEGLNKPAQLTFWNIYRKDKKTGEVYTSGPKAEKFAKALQGQAAIEGAKFVSYKVQGGVWKLEVEHFSRYGLLDDYDDSDDDDDADDNSNSAAAGGAIGPAITSTAPPTATASATSGGGATATGLTSRKPGVSFVAANGFGHDRAAFTTADVDGSTEDVDMGGPALASATAATLQHGLATGLQQDPRATRTMRDAFFAPREEAVDMEYAGEPVTSLVLMGASHMQHSPALRKSLRPTGAATALPTQPLVHAAHNWKRKAAPLAGIPAGARSMSSPSAFPRQTAAEEVEAPSTSSGSTPAINAAALLADPGVTSHFVDAGLSLGRTFRVGWGPGGALVWPGGSIVRPRVQLRRVRAEGSGFTSSYSLEEDDDERLDSADDGRQQISHEQDPADRALALSTFGGGSTELAASDSELNVQRRAAANNGTAHGTVLAGGQQAAALRERLTQLLEVHFHFSKQVSAPGAADADGSAEAGTGVASTSNHSEVPEWRLHCDAQRLHHLAANYIATIERQIAAAKAGAANRSGGGLDSDAAFDDGEGSGSGGRRGDDNDAPADLQLLLLRHGAETWRLLEALFGHIDDELLEPVVLSADATAPRGDEPSDGVAAADAEMLDQSPGPRSASGAVGNGVQFTGAGNSDLEDAVEVERRCVLAAFQRRAGVSRWLQRQAKPRVEAGLASDHTHPSAVVLQLLSGHQTAAAAAAAVACGDGRLATLVAASAAGGARASACAEINAQLQTWAAEGLDSAVHPERLAVYQLLAGRVEEVQELLGADWRRVLGMLLWYSGPATASVAEAVQHFTSATINMPRVIPGPTPLYAEDAPPSQALDRVTDLHFELLQLWGTTPSAAVAAAAASGPGVAVAVSSAAVADGLTSSAIASRIRPWIASEGLSRLLRPAGYSPNNLDASTAWHVAGALQAVGVLPPPFSSDAASASEDGLEASGRSAAAADGPVPSSSFFSPAPSGPAFRRIAAEVTAATADAVLSAHLAFIAQLELVGGMTRWALYVACHIPQVTVRRRVVAQLLLRYCPQWAGNGEAAAEERRFYTEVLGLPTPMLADAEATWAGYCHCPLRECRALLRAQRWREAHALLAATIAPRLLLSSRVEDLNRLLSQLQPHASALGLEWSTGGGLYASYMALLQGAASSGSHSATASEMQALQDLAANIQATADEVKDRWQKLATRLGGISTEQADSLVTQQLVLSHMAATVSRTLGGQAAMAAAAAAGGGPQSGSRAAASALTKALKGSLTSQGIEGVGLLGRGLQLSCLEPGLRAVGIATAAAVAGSLVLA